MGTSFDPATHSIITGADGAPVPQVYDPEANSGAGGFVALTESIQKAITAGAADIADLETLLTNFNNEDFATETTLDTRLSSLETKMDTLLNSQDADNNINVSQKGSIVAIDTDGSILSASVQEARMLSTDTQPDATAFPKGTYLIEIDTDVIYYNDGNGNWVEK